MRFIFVVVFVVVVDNALERNVCNDAETPWY